MAQSPIYTMDRGSLTQSVSNRNKLILIALWSFIFGILGATFLPIAPLVCVLIWVLAFVIYFLDKQLIVVIVLCFFALGAFRYDIKDFHELKPAGNAGIVVSEPEKRGTDTRFVVKTDTGEKILVTTDLFSEVWYGDKVELIGKAKLLKPGGYAEYLAKNDIFYTMDQAKVAVASQGHGNPVLEALLRIKAAFTERVREILPEPESSLLAGLIVSGKQALPKPVTDDFRDAGLIHIVVLSGYNITIIAEFLLILFAFLGVRRAAIVSATGVLLFVLMSGASATVMRGAIMVLLLIFGRIWGRRGDAPRILLFTAVAMLMFNPKALVYDASFQLSFLAMLGIVYGVPVIQRLAERLLPALGRASGKSRPIVSRLTETIYTTLATQVFVLPFILYNMGNFSLVFLITNILVLLVLPYTMLVGFVAGLVAFISITLAWPLAYAAHLLLKWILFVADFFGNLSFSSIEIENFPMWGSLLMYLVLGVILWRARGSLPRSSSLDF